MTTTVSQEAREAEVTVTQADRDAALPILCHLYVRKDEEPALFIGEVRAGKYDDHYLVQAFARHRQSAERGEVVGYIIPEMLNRKSEFEANGIVLHSRPSGMATMPLYTLTTPPEAA